MASNDTTPAFGIDAKAKLDSELKTKDASATLTAEGEAHLRVESNGGYTYSDNTRLEGSAKASLGPVSLDGGAGHTTASQASETYDGTGTHIVVGHEVGDWIKGGIGAAGYGYSGKFEHGERATYEVTVPAPYKVDAKAINPYDPTTLPTGTVISYDSTRYDNETSGITFGKAVGNVGVHGDRKHDDGVTMRIEKTGDHTVRVAVTQNDRVDDTSRIGPELGKLSPQLGRDGKMTLATTTTAEFDLSTREGQEAYGQVLAGQALPQRDGQGVSGVSTTQKLGIDTQPRAGLKGVGETDIGKHVDTSYELVHDKDRSEITFHYDVPGAISARSTFPLGDDHQPDMSKGKYFSITLPHMDVHQAGALRTAFGGTAGTRGLEDGQPVEMKFTGEQLMQMRQRARDYIEHHGQPGMLRDLDAGKEYGGSADMMAMAAMATAKNPREVFDAMQMQDGKFLAANLTKLDVGMTAPKPPLPGTLEIQPSAAMARQLASMPEGRRAEVMDEFYRAPALATEASLGLGDRSHTDDARYEQARAGVRQLDATMGRTPDVSSERLTAALAAAGRRDGLDRIDHVVLSGDGKQAYAVQGELDSPHKRIAVVDTGTAVQTPVEQSNAQWRQAEQAKPLEPAIQPEVTQATPMR
ncbi:MAG: hypothetical protein GAK28_03850 [Luteibacter sp.]|uniref:XVIPCD domain-containing protein n=1 Tax=Luteibacter sp. TaxID=1886636 RepID=UPI00137F3224|nr:XVIPCD domain-containing protein [Luteibacter sp.]KAF1004648.1 MAG: hypothetical protein GAK28_03850 [Luteibacter sp.]